MKEEIIEKKKLEINKLHDRLVNCAVKNKSPEELLISTYYNNALFPILNYLIKDIEPTQDEIEMTKYLIEEWEKDIC